MSLTITIPGPPQPQQRMRATIRGAHASVYEPAESRNWKATAQQHMADALADIGESRPWDCTLRVEITAVFPLPTTERRKNPVPRRWHTKANGDTDNIAKAVLDAGNAVLWRDDSLIAELVVRKYVAAQDESARVEVRVKPIVDAPCQPVESSDTFAVVTRGPVGELFAKSTPTTGIRGSAAISARRHQ